MKKSLFVLLSIIISLTSCQNESNISADGVEKDIELEIKTSSSMSRAAIESEERIERLDVLVFQGLGDDAKFLYRRYAWKNGDTHYRTTLKMGDNLTLYFVANAKEVLDASTSLKDGSEATWKDIKEELMMSAPKDLKHSNGLPMWGRLINQTIEDKLVNSLGTIALLRSVSSVDFSFTNDVNNFNLQSVYLVYAANKGYLHYDPEKTYTTSSGKLVANAPYAPEDMLTNVDWEYSVSAGTKSVENVFYMYDNDTPLPSTGINRQTKLVMKGIWQDASGVNRATYYPVAFREVDANSGEATRLQAIRNNKYVISVSGVNGDGFDSLEDAKNGEEVNISYKVIAWEYEDEEFMIDGNQYVSLERKKANMYKAAPATWDKIGMSTSYSMDDIRMSSEKDVVGEKGIHKVYFKDEQTNEEFGYVELEENNNRFNFIFSATKTMTGSNKNDYRQATIYVRVGRISFEIVVRQYNGNPNDWGDGGNTDWP